MAEVLISAENVSKKFCRSLKKSLWYGVKDIGSSLLPWNNGRSATSTHAESELRPDEFWALRDISFEVKRGECLGLVGHNGAGKSTLLKILNGLNRPDHGRIVMRGRIGALIELGAGFNPILTGRENIYNQAALLGFSRKETDRRFDEIVEFSELEDFLDMPVQNYSSGMKVKLGFAVSSQMDPDVLLIDEVLAVGDVGFRAKCLSRIGELINNAAVIFVSHSTPAVARISTQILHLDQGQTKLFTRDLSEGIDSYFSCFGLGDVVTTGTGDVRVTEVCVTGNGNVARNGETLQLGYGDEVRLDATLEFGHGIQDATLQYLIYNQEMLPVLEVLGPGMRRFRVAPDETGKCHVSTTIPRLNFNSGKYQLSLRILSVDGMTTFCGMDRVLNLNVLSNHASGCSNLICTDWRIDDPQLASVNEGEEI